MRVTLCGCLGMFDMEELKKKHALPVKSSQSCVQNNNTIIQDIIHDSKVNCGHFGRQVLLFQSSCMHVLFIHFRLPQHIERPSTIVTNLRVCFVNVIRAENYFTVSKMSANDAPRLYDLKTVLNNSRKVCFGSFPYRTRRGV